MTGLRPFLRQENHKQRQGIRMENQFVRHEPCFERILFVLTLDKKKMKERILIGEEQQIRFRLDGSKSAEVLFWLSQSSADTHSRFLPLPSGPKPMRS